MKLFCLITLCFTTAAFATPSTFKWAKRGTIASSIQCGAFNADGLFVDRVDEAACKDYQFARVKNTKTEATCANTTAEGVAIKLVDEAICHNFSFAFGQDFWGNVRCAQHIKEGEAAGHFLRWTDGDDACTEYSFDWRQNGLGTIKCAKVTADEKVIAIMKSLLPCEK